MWVWIGYGICMITLEFKLCTNMIIMGICQRKGLAEDPMGRPGGMKGGPPPFGTTSS